MRAKELLEIIYSGSESRHLEYKESMDWGHELTKAKITRAILSFANTQDGGVIVVGVKQVDNKFSFDGMSDEHIKTFDHDNIANHVANYADPYVDFTLKIVEDAGKKFVVIQVPEFSEHPVICKRDGLDLKNGALFIRMKGKPGTSEISSNSEIREILDIAVRKGIRKFHKISNGDSLPVSSEDRQIYQKKFAEELTLRDSDDVLRKIHSRGYWRIILRPTLYKSDRIASFAECKRKIKESVLELTGWSYPYFAENELKTIKNWVECSVCFKHLIEHWRFYRSGQFYHVVALFEDWILDKPPEGIYGPKTPTKRVLSVEVPTQLLTMIFEFAARLAQKEVFGNEVTITIELNDMENRHLYYSSKNFYSITPYTSFTPTINLDVVLNTGDLITNSKKLAIDYSIKIFELFNYDDLPRKVLEEMQDKFLKRQSL